MVGKAGLMDTNMGYRCDESYHSVGFTSCECIHKRFSDSYSFIFYDAVDAADFWNAGISQMDPSD